MATTNGLGFYQIELETGTYSVTAVRSGYEESTVSNIEIISGEVYSLDFQLTPLETSAEIPTVKNSHLAGNYPNPFNPETVISFEITPNDSGELTIFNTKGEKLFTRLYSAGKHEYIWNATDQASGIYFYRLKTSKQIINKKMLLLK